MKLLDSVLISLSAAFFIIGVHQTFYYGVAASYWLFMLSLVLFFYLKVVKAKRKEESKNFKNPPVRPKKSEKSKSRK